MCKASPIHPCTPGVVEPEHYTGAGLAGQNQERSEGGSQEHTASRSQEKPREAREI